MLSTNHLRNVLDIMDELPKGQGHESAAALLFIMVNLYAKQIQMDNLDPHFTSHEIQLMELAQKISAVKSVKQRLGMTLGNAREYVEHYGGKYLARSGLYNTSGTRLD